MAEPYLAEIRIFSFGFPPKGWAFCNGQTLAINQNQALFSLLGTFYGGNGIQTFQLPNAQGNALGMADGSFPLGATTGAQSVSLQYDQMPPHSHTLTAGGKGIYTNPGQKSLGTPAVNRRFDNMYSASSSQTASSQFIASSGQGQPHNNMQPYLVLNFCIALQGIYPSHN